MGQTVTLRLPLDVASVKIGRHEKAGCTKMAREIIQIVCCDHEVAVVELGLEHVLECVRVASTTICLVVAIT